jgi:nitric oxide reductase NorD protein
VAEAEEVIGDAARHAAGWTWHLWKRLRARDEAPRLELVDVTKRLELLLEALFDTRIPVRAANPPAVPSVLARLWRRSARLPGDLSAVPATDGRSIFLPARIVASEASTAFGELRRMGAQQSMRCVRGTTLCFPFDRSPLVRDLYLLSEVAASDAALSIRFPGFRRILQVARRELAQGSRLASSELNEKVAALYRALLDAPPEAPPSIIRANDTPQASLQWAASMARELAPSADHYRGMERNDYMGEILRPEPLDTRTFADASHEDREHPRARRIIDLTRRPRVRKADDDEEDSGSGLWMVQTSEPIEHLEDPMGLQRPTDREEDGDPEGLGDSLSELGEARVVRTPHAAREILLSEDPPRTQGAPATHDRADGETLRYPEWDYRRASYRVDAVAVRCTEGSEGSQTWVDGTVARRRAMLNEIRRRFLAIRARRSVIPRQPEGDELDLDAIVQTYAERCTGVASEGRPYQLRRPARRDIAIMMLVDASGSTDGWASATDRVIDVEKEALLVVAVAVQALGMPYAIQAFSGQGPAGVAVRSVKRFDERYGADVGRRIAGLEPEAFTRIGAALRHATRELMQQRAHRRLLLLLSDGKPNDIDEYEGRYGVEDTRQAIHEARRSSIDTFALTIDRVGARYLPLLFGPGRYRVLQRPEQLSTALVEWLRRAALSIQ